MGTVIAVMLGSALALTTGDDPIVVITAQVLLALLLVAVSTVLTRQLHDQIPSALRAGVTSGVGTLTWIGFLPLAIAFGLLSKHSGIDGAAWLLVATTAATGASLLRLAAARHTATAAHTTQPLPSPAPVDLVQARN
jgi:uncharacterized membrane protein YGL010W